jgi:O-antigen/teichoic acid export membrane protein
LTLAASGYSSFALAWATVATGAARGLIAQSLRPAWPWPVRLDGMKPVLAFGSQASTLYLTGALGSRTPDLIVGKALGVFAVGLFSRAVALSDQFRTLISGAIASVFFPAFARIRDRGEPLGPAYLRVCSGYSAVIWPGMAGLALAAEPLVRLLYGETWIKSAPILSVIAVTEIILVALPMVTDIPILMGKLRKLLVFNMVDTTLSVLLLIAGCRWGIEGAAYSRLVYGVAWFMLYFRFIHGLIKLDIRRLLSIYALSGLGTLAAITPLVLTYRFWVSPHDIGFFTLAAASGAGVIAWLATLAVTKHPALDELLGLAASLPIARFLPFLAGRAP